MIIKPILSDSVEFPESFRYLINNAKLYDRSCSEQAKVIFIDKDGGYYLKSAAKGTLENEAILARFFNSKHLSSRVVEYISEEKDWLLTEKVSGEDCTCAKYLADPKRLCDLLAECLRNLHDIDFVDCPVMDRNESYLNYAMYNYKHNVFDDSIFDNKHGYSADDAWKLICNNKHMLKSDVLIHGDYCLPNIILDNWKFSGFIDLGNAGVGDRHIDIFWAVWSLNYNLKTDKYRNRFFDAYGRDKINLQTLDLISVIELFG